MDIRIGRDTVSNVSNGDFPGHRPGATDGDGALADLQRRLDIKIHQLNDETANFDLIGVDTSIANALRRIMLAEVPAVAIETVFIEMNTSVIQDEVLAGRLGLLPIKVSPDVLEWVETDDATPVDPETKEKLPHNSNNTIVFDLNVKCTRNPAAKAGETDPAKLYINSNVYARDLVYVPTGDQAERIQPAPTVANPDILLCKLRPGQELAIKCYAILGIGSDHAKFSPVSTASYRLMPTIEITGDIAPELATKFQQCFAPGVIEVEGGRPVVADPRRDTVSREVLRHPEFADKVRLGRRRDQFIFNVESAGAMEPDEIFVKSIQELRRKASDLLKYEL